MTEIEGLFEIHIIVAQDDVAKLFMFATSLLSDKKHINPKCTCAQSFYGNYPIQPMLTFWLNGTESSVVSQAKEIQKDMEEQNIECLRLKVESLISNKNVPTSSDDVHYYEFHFKIKYNLPEYKPIPEQWKELERICKRNSVPLFFNSYSKKSGIMIPVTTLRCYDMSVETAKGLLVDFTWDIQRHGYDTFGEVQSEYSVLDTNVYMDENWLFTGQPQDLITTY